jgi:hypothetical protein
MDEPFEVTPGCLKIRGGGPGRNEKIAALPNITPVRFKEEYRTTRKRTDLTPGPLPLRSEEREGENDILA